MEFGGAIIRLMEYGDANLAKPQNATKLLLIYIVKWVDSPLGSCSRRIA